MREKATTPIKIDNKILKYLYAKLCTRCDFQQLNELNRNYGSYNESHDYVQETLITLVEKLKADKVRFYTMSALWAWCCSTLGMRLMRQHRDYTLVKSRTAFLVDYQGTTQSGARIDDVASSKHADVSKFADGLYQQKEDQNFVLAYSNTNAEIVSIYKLYTIDASCTVINLAKVLESIDEFGTQNGLTRLGIPKWSIDSVAEAILEFKGISGITECNNTVKNHVLGSREIAQLKQVHEISNKNKMITIAELENALCLNNN